VKQIKSPTLRDLYPHLDDKALKRVEEFYDEYLLLVLRIFDRLEAEKRAAKDGDLTADNSAIGSTNK